MISPTSDDAENAPGLVVQAHAPDDYWDIGHIPALEGHISAAATDGPDDKRADARL
jgi:hypothetical protein